MKGHNYGLCRKCGKNHVHPRGMKGKTHSDSLKNKWSKERRGVNHPHWKGGRVLVAGYVYIYKPNHPNCTKNGYVCEHRLTMENHLGRLLTKKEVVHHIDGKKENNLIDNLQLVSGVGNHAIKYHVSRGVDGRFALI